MASIMMLTSEVRPVDPADWAAVYDTIPFPLYVTDIDRHEIVAVNRAMRERTGAEAGQPCFKAIFRQDQPCVGCTIASLVAQPEVGAAPAVREQYSDDDDCWYQTLNALGTWADGRRVQVSIVVDVTAFKDTQAKLVEAHADMALRNRRLHDIAVTDALTCLVNRRRLDEIVTNEVVRCRRYGEPLSLIMLDVDHFKAVNDAFGHSMGDAVLVELAALLRRGSRITDVSGRWGGEEFLVICPGSNLAGAIVLAENLRRSLESLTIPEVGSITASFGVAQLDGTETAADLVARADAALYRAKKGGRNRVEAELLDR